MSGEIVSVGGHLQAVNVSAWRGQVQILREVNWEFAQNTITAIYGENGSGKSTFLRCLNDLFRHDNDTRAEGTVLLNGMNISTLNPVRLRREIGTLPQNAEAISTKSIYDNIVAGLALQQWYFRWPWQADHTNDEVVKEMLSLVGLEALQKRLYQPGTNLSGGQLQRMCFARAIVNKPSVLLLDEPFQGQDGAREDQLEDLIISLAARMTVVVITHKLKQARRIATTLLEMKEGKLVVR